jgi:hypothetical protein
LAVLTNSIDSGFRCIKDTDTESENNEENVFKFYFAAFIAGFFLLLPCLFSRRYVVASGPVSGVSWGATGANAGLLPGLNGAVEAVVRKVSPEAAVEPDVTGIIVPTVLQISSDMLNWFTGMTCLYDRYHQEEQDRVTLPIAMFHVRKITETWQSEASKKRVIMYEPPLSKPADNGLADSIRPGVMQTVVDNIVRQPKTYQMEIIVPFQPVGRYISEGIESSLAVINGIMNLFGDVVEGVADIIRSYFSASFSVLSMARTAAEAAGKLPSMDGVSFINKNSLEAMAESGRILTMKMWTGYQYKYVVITGMTIDKQPQEDDVFRGTLQLQEMPILTMTVPDKKKVSGIDRNWAASAVSAVHKVLSEPLALITQVEDAAYGKPIGFDGKAGV